MNRFTLYIGNRFMPDPIITADPKMIKFIIGRRFGRLNKHAGFPTVPGHALAPHHQPPKETVLLKENDNLSTLDLIAFINRTGVCDFLTVLLGEGPPSHSHTGMQLVVIVNTSGIG